MTDEEKLKQLDAVVMRIVRDYATLSNAKTRQLRDEYIKQAKKLLENIYD